MSDRLVVENAVGRPDLIEALAALRWFEMGLEPGLERRADWVAATARESGSRLPATFVAGNGTDDVVGGVRPGVDQATAADATGGGRGTVLTRGSRERVARDGSLRSLERPETGIAMAQSAES